MISDAARAAEMAARDSYGRLLAIVAARTRDVAAAEDALAEAFAKALADWPARGVPEKPEAWLVTVARRAAGGAARRRATAAAGAPEIERAYAEMEARLSDGQPFPDERLKLMFACAHPAIDPAIRTPLMLQCVLGLDADAIGAAFVTPGPTMGQRLVRAKTKIKAAGVPFAAPEIGDLPDRLDDVLAAIYAAFGAAWDAAPGADAPCELAGEALFLARLVADLAPNEPEPKGLLALMLYCEARRPARRSETGAYLPLHEQDRTRWRGAMIDEAEALLRDAARARQFGRFQTEAAIQSVHVNTPAGDAPDAGALVALYDLLCAHRPSLGALVGRALAHGAQDGAEAGLARLSDAPEPAANRYQPYWAAKFRLARAAGREELAKDAQDRAIALASDPAVRAWLESA